MLAHLQWKLFGHPGHPSPSFVPTILMSVVIMYGRCQWMNVLRLDVVMMCCLCDGSGFVDVFTIQYKFYP